MIPAAAHVQGLQQVTLFHCGHQHLAERLPLAARHKLAAVMFNLGYLPGAPKDIVTRTDSTLAALQQALAYLRVGGRVSLVLYRGHPGGQAEASAVRSYAQNLPAEYSATHCARLNTTEPAPELLIIERLGASS